jgi:hypothetical protein
MRKTMNDTALMRVEWETVTGVLGPNLRIFPPGTDVTDVNTSCRSKDKRVLATGDDFGHVKLFNYPVTVSFLNIIFKGRLKYTIASSARRGAAFPCSLGLSEW